MLDANLNVDDLPLPDAALGVHGPCHPRVFLDRGFDLQEQKMQKPLPKVLL
jgi:hypothetical protein